VLFRLLKIAQSQITIIKEENTMKKSCFKAGLFLALGLFALMIVSFPGYSYAKTAAEINASADAAMSRFKKDVKGAEAYLKIAKGVLIMPNITKAGFIVGGQYGQGALRIDGKSVNYYSLVSGSIGYQIGAEQYDMIILFTTEQALNSFRNSEGWEAGVDGDVTLVNIGADVSVETLRSQNPILGFVFDQKGLMVGVSVKGAKFTKIKAD
jgi:lipid-binding SYLF domain-containing protein